MPVFVPAKPFQPSLIIGQRLAESYLMGRLLVLNHKYDTSLKNLNKTEHYSLFYPSVSDEKKF
jgi:hypothetical protein